MVQTNLDVQQGDLNRGALDLKSNATYKTASHAASPFPLDGQLTLNMFLKDFYCILKSAIFSYGTINNIYCVLIQFQIGGTLQILWQCQHRAEF